MDERERQELEAVEALVNEPGWAVLMRQTQERIDAFRVGAPFNINDEKQLYFIKGVIATLNELLGTADRTAAARRSFEEPAEEGETE